MHRGSSTLSDNQGQGGSEIGTTWASKTGKQITGEKIKKKKIIFICPISFGSQQWTLKKKIEQPGMLNDCLQRSVLKEIFMPRVGWHMNLVSDLTFKLLYLGLYLYTRVFADDAS